MWKEKKERGTESIPDYFNGFTWYDGPGIGKNAYGNTFANLMIKKKCVIFEVMNVT